jgi:hypothetical protein
MKAAIINRSASVQNLGLLGLGLLLLVLVLR